MFGEGGVSKTNRATMTADEVAEIELGSPRPKGSALVQQFRESHHAVARMVASGMTDMMIRRRTGYTGRLLKQLKETPAFQQLISDYKDEVFEKINADTDSFAELSIANMTAAERQIADKLAEADEQGLLLPFNDLHKIVSDRADRFGYSKRVTNTNINVDIAVALDRAIERSGAVRQIEGRGNAHVIEHQHAPPEFAPQAHPPVDVLVGEEQASRPADPPPQPIASRVIRPRVLRRV